MTISNGIYWYFYDSQKLKMTNINQFFHYYIILNPLDKNSVVQIGNYSVF